MKPKKKEKILVAISGGVDSSVAAALLVKAGYDVTGAFMVNYGASPDRLRPTSSASSSGLRPTGYPKNGFTGRSSDEVGSEPCWHGDYQDALRVAAKLKIPLLRLDFIKEYQKFVLDYCFKQYSLGRTPNPDILCNKFVKFGAWLEKARELGFDKLATGHYARVAVSPCPMGRIRGGGSVQFKLISAKDTNKDQTYFLHQLNQKQLSRILFPIGNYTKPQVRALAKKFDLSTAEKAESMGICFVGEMPMREFLKGKVKAKPGKIISTTGEVVGEHDGLPFYTIGERVAVRFPPPARGGGEGVVGASSGTPPLFVIEKNTKTNTLTVAPNTDPALFKKEITVTNINWLAGQTPTLPLKCKVRLRHRQELQDALVLSCHSEAKPKNPLKNGGDKTRGKGSFANAQDDNCIITFTKPQRAVTPGQFAVFYLKGECLGGGEIN